MNEILANLSSIHASSTANFISGLVENFRLHDAVDILIVAFFIYVILLFIKQTRSYFIFNTVVLLVIISYASVYFNLELTRKLFEPFLTFFVIIFVIVFQREIRRFFRWLVSRRRVNSVRKTNATLELCSILTESLFEMAKVSSGAIIVLPGEYPLDEFIEGGFPLDGKVTAPLILSIFDHTTPGHDGAMIIENNRVRRFGAHLPLAQAESYMGFAKAGTRHRAAVGITEQTDALALVVSEERGVISIAEEGALKPINSREELDLKLKSFLNAKEEEETETVFHYIVINNFWTKLLSVVIAALLWFFLVFNTSTANRDIIVPLEFKYVPDSLEVDRVSPASVDVTLSGDNSDIQNLDVNDIRVIVDLTNATSGVEQITIDDSNVTYPAYLTLIKASPQRFSVTLEPTATAKTAGQ
jgi:diadenylate cyclase